MAAYLISSLVRRLVNRIGVSFRYSGRYSSRITVWARSSWVPTTTRSGRLKSSIAAPSRRNSGLDTTTTSASGRTRLKIASISSPVPTGTVDLVTMTVKPSTRPAISSAAA